MAQGKKKPKSDQLYPRPSQANKPAAGRSIRSIMPRRPGG